MAMVYWDSSQAAGLARALGDQFRDMTAQIAWMDPSDLTGYDEQVWVWSTQKLIAPTHL
jgi:hypothetical protein